MPAVSWVLRPLSHGSGNLANALGLFYSPGTPRLPALKLNMLRSSRAAQHFTTKLDTAGGIILRSVD